MTEMPEELYKYCMVLQAYAAVAVKPSSSVRALKIAVGALSVGAAVLLLGAVGTFYFWNGNDKHVRQWIHFLSHAPYLSSSSSNFPGFNI